MGDALDDFYYYEDSLDTICPIHKCLYDGATTCPKCDDEHYEALTHRIRGE